jgi:hypothetical protein
LGALCLAAPGWAQDAASQRRLDVDVSAPLTYDSNFLRLAENVPPPPGQSRDDIRFTPSLSLNFEMPVSRHSIFMTGTAGYVFHRENQELNSERLELQGGGDLRLASCAARLTGSFSRQQSDLADLLTPERRKNIELRTTQEVRVNCASGGGLRPGLAYVRERAENGDPARRSGNYTAQTYSAEMAYERPALGQFALGASASEGVYDERRLDVAGSDGVKSYTVDVTFRRTIGSQLTGYITGGFTRVDPGAADVPGFKGLSWSADLTWNPGTRLQASFGAAREAQQSNLLNISYSIVDSYRGQAIYALGERIRLSVRASHTKRLLRDSLSQPGELLSGEDRTSRLGAGATFSAGGRLLFLLDANAERRRAENTLFNYNNYSLAFTARLSV